MDLRRTPRLNASPAPSCTQQHAIDENESEMEDSMLQFHFEELKNKIKPLLGVLGKEPVTLLEKAIANSDDITANQNIVRQAEKLLADLTLLVDKRHLETKSLWNEINQFWHELEDNHEPQLGFSNAHSGIHEALKVVKTEYLKRKEEKSKRIVQYIELLRSELTHIWNHCLISEGEKLSFTPFYDSNYNEELLRVHKEELDRWKIYQEKNQEILRKAKQREEMWLKLKELDAKADDPSRFINRGGALLKDQQTHASILKNLPKLESDLKKMAARFEQEHGRKVTILGQDIHTLIDREWENYNSEKSMKKQATRSKIRQSVAPTMPMGPPAPSNTIKRAPPTPIFSSAAKRKCFTPISNGNLD